MFTVGQSYYLTFWASAADGTITSKATAVEVAIPLIRFRDESGVETIVNVHSPAFAGAKLDVE
jgi:hypothetical protein